MMLIIHERAVLRHVDTLAQPPIYVKGDDPVYYCGYRGLMHLLDSAQLNEYADYAEYGEYAGVRNGNGPTFALPGDKATYAPDRPADVVQDRKSTRLNSS